jgi:predicted Zn-dependent protease
LRLARADLPTAASSFDAVLAHRPGQLAALYGRARLALRRGDYDAADAGFAMLEDEAPRKPYGAYGRALVAARRGRTDDACAALARAAELGIEPSDARRMDLDREGHPLRAAPCYRRLLAGARGRA